MRRACIAAAVWLSLAPWTPAQPVAVPDPSDSVLRALGAPYLSDAEKKDLRVFHGLWRDSDLDTPQRRATSALIRGALSDPSLTDPSVGVEDRAEAAAQRGELAGALALLEHTGSIRALRIRAEALEGLGRAADAAAALEGIEKRVAGARTAADLTESARALMVRARVAPQRAAAGGDFQVIVSMLARARTDLDRLYWPAHVSESAVLFSKDNRKEGGDAVMEALRLNPRSAAAWRLMGDAAVDGFNFDAAEQVARRLESLAAPEVSADAAMILARARMRQNDPDGALQALAPALAAYPAMRQVLALRAGAVALQYDQTATDRLLAEFDALSPGSPDACFQVGRALSEARQYEMSERYLDEAVKRAPHRSRPVTELGLMLMQAGRDQRALDVLTRAWEVDPFNTRAGNSLKLVRDLLTHPTVESEHFIIRYTPGPDQVLAREMPDLLETMRRRVSGRGPGGIDHDVPGKTLIDLMPDHRAFAVRIAGITAIHTMAAATGPLIAMESPREGGGHTGPYDWLRVVRHEYTHTVTLSRTRNRIPHWFTEAAAVYLEDAPRDYATCRLLDAAYQSGTLFDMSEINLAFVRPKKPTDRSQAYAQGHWMYQYIVERWGERAPLDLMDLYATGVREASAFQRVLGLSQDEFLAAFHGWAGGQLASWGMGPRAPSIRALLVRELAADETKAATLEVGLGSLLDTGAWAALTGEPGGSWRPPVPAPTQAMVDRWLLADPANPDLLELAVELTVGRPSEPTAGSETRPTQDMAPLLERYAAARPVDPLPHKLLARLYLDTDPDRAVEHLEFLDAREQSSPAYAAELARRYAARGDLPRAIGKARRAVIISPFDAASRELLAGLLVQSGDLPGAEAQVQALVVLEPGRPVHLQRLKAIRERMGK
ncbi:MAG: tetratricopeptide repeat protein [Phycisphaerales bacterium]|nr:tetratricopeptide repeat protein [Phycisphaerales bacterium]